MDEQKKVLIIEDEHSLVDLLVAKLEKAGYSVNFAYDGEEGYKKILEWEPDLILLDIVMPKMDGYEVLEKLVELKKSKKAIQMVTNTESWQTIKEFIM